MGLMTEIAKDHQLVINKTLGTCSTEIKQVAQLILETFDNEGKVLLFGNGGSAADAQHVAAEFTNRFETERQPLPVLALTTDTSALTAIGNDYSFEDVFAKQVSAFGQTGDVAIGISTSGTSKNVVHALNVAKKRGLKTILFSGEIGFCTDTIENLDHLVAVPSRVTARIQEAHILIWHIICSIVDKHYEVNKP